MADVVTRVVTWHNRHPLARRITRADVGAVGVVALPFAVAAEAPDTSTLPANALPLFDGHWLYRTRGRQLGRWVRRHGVYPLRACADWPARQIDANLALSRQADQQGHAGRTLRHVILATVEQGGQQIRVLVAADGSPRRAAVWGPRLWSAPRSAAAGMLAVGAMAGAWLPGIGAHHAPGLPPEPHSTSAQGAVLDAPVLVAGVAPAPHPADIPAAPHGDAPPAREHAAAEATPPRTASSSAALVDGHAGSPSGHREPASHDADAAHPAESAHPVGPSGARDPLPADVATADHGVRPQAPGPAPRPDDVPVRLWNPTSGEPPLVSIRPRLGDDAQRRARVEATTLRRAPDGAAPTEPLTAGPVFALVTRATRQREDAQGQQILLQGLQAQAATGRPTRVELMASGGRWRVVWWPLPDRRRAEDLLLEARARGLKVEVVSF